MKKIIECNFRINYNFNNSRLSNSTKLNTSKQYQQPNTHRQHTMKNIKPADHFAEYTSNANQLQSSALYNAQQYLSLPDWQTGDFPHVDLVNQ